MQEPKRGGCEIDIQYLIDRLENLLNEGWHIPSTARTLVNERDFLDIIDQMRIAVPEEIKRAKRISQEHDQIVAQAKIDAEQIVMEAQEQAAFLLQDSELLKQAQQRADLIVNKAQEQAGEVRQGADEYSLEVLRRLESQLDSQMATVRRGIEALHHAS
ncbi:MAG: ATPase [Chloroflexi bacterium]|nr:ATPase [Chloroflexota bacterium]MBU1746559.1 ATPase [Chloroflexota bacterium]